MRGEDTLSASNATAGNYLANASLSAYEKERFQNCNSRGTSLSQLFKHALLLILKEPPHVKTLYTLFSPRFTFVLQTTLINDFAFWKITMQMGNIVKLTVFDCRQLSDEKYNSSAT